MTVVYYSNVTIFNVIFCRKTPAFFLWGTFMYSTSMNSRFFINRNLIKNKLYAAVNFFFFFNHNYLLQQISLLTIIISCNKFILLTLSFKKKDQNLTGDVLPAELCTAGHVDDCLYQGGISTSTRVVEH